MTARNSSAPRPGEVDGLHYHFVTAEHFADLVARGEMLEWAVVHGRNCYGTPRGPVEEALREGRMAMLEIDLQGARQVREAMPDAFLVFLAPPTWEDLVDRLVDPVEHHLEDRRGRPRRPRTVPGPDDRTGGTAQAPHVGR